MGPPRLSRRPNRLDAGHTVWSMIVRGWTLVAGAAGEAGPRRAWLWISVALLAVLALLAGMAMRAAGRGGGPEAWMVGVVAVCAGLLLTGEIVGVLAGIQAREAAKRALGALPPAYRISGRIRVRGHRRAAVIDHLVVGPDGRAWAVTVDGSTRPPRPGDPTDGLRPLLAVARRAAEFAREAARAGVLPEELRVPAGTQVMPCILVARRPMDMGMREGVLAFGATDAASAFGAEGMD